MLLSCFSVGSVLSVRGIAAERIREQLPKESLPLILKIRPDEERARRVLRTRQRSMKSLIALGLANSNQILWKGHARNRGDTPKDVRG
ncbi:hypothetical protein J3R74_003789 [Puniceicoccus vermicola]